MFKKIIFVSAMFFALSGQAATYHISLANPNTSGVDPAGGVANQSTFIVLDQPLPASFNFVGTLTTQKQLVELGGFGLYLNDVLIYNKDASNFTITSDNKNDLYSVQFSFSGLAALPTDNYYLKFNIQQGGNFGLTSTITSAAAPVPEPESYALMVLGLGVVAGIARRRKQA